MSILHRELTCRLEFTARRAAPLNLGGGGGTGTLSSLRGVSGTAGKCGLLISLFVCLKGTSLIGLSHTAVL